MQSLTNLALGYSKVVYWGDDGLGNADVVAMHSDGEFYTYFFGPHNRGLDGPYFQGQHYGIPGYYDFYDIGWGNQPRILDPRWGNTDRNPLLVNGYIPSWGWPSQSPMIDAGCKDKINPWPPDWLKSPEQRRPQLAYSLFPNFDFLGYPRVVGQVDLGAVENQMRWGVLYVRAGVPETTRPGLGQCRARPGQRVAHARPV